MALSVYNSRPARCADEMKNDGGRWREEEEEEEEDRERQKRIVRGENVEERKREIEKNGGAEGVGEGRRGNGIVMSPASSSSDSQSRKFAHRMCAGRFTTVQVKS